jgi:hypothetical protein
LFFFAFGPRQAQTGADFFGKKPKKQSNTAPKTENELFCFGK